MASLSKLQPRTPPAPTTAPSNATITTASRAPSPSSGAARRTSATSRAHPPPSAASTDPSTLSPTPSSSASGASTASAQPHPPVPPPSPCAPSPAASERSSAPSHTTSTPVSSPSSSVSYVARHDSLYGSDTSSPRSLPASPPPRTPSPASSASPAPSTSPASPFFEAWTVGSPSMWDSYPPIARESCSAAVAPAEPGETPEQAETAHQNKTVPASASASVVPPPTDWTPFSETSNVRTPSMDVTLPKIARESCSAAVAPTEASGVTPPPQTKKKSKTADHNKARRVNKGRAKKGKMLLQPLCLDTDAKQVTGLHGCGARDNADQENKAPAHKQVFSRKSL